MAVIAGSMGRIVEQLPGADAPRKAGQRQGAPPVFSAAKTQRPARIDNELGIWTGVLRRELSADAVIHFLRTTASLSKLTFEINDVCNLRCGYCYLGRRETKGRTASLSNHEWAQVFAQAPAMGVEVLALVGKEPFIDHQGVEILTMLDDLKRGCREDGEVLRYGVITNGTLLPRYLHELTALDLDYLDMSVDGIPALHDAVRGKGSFAKTAAALAAAVKLDNIGSVMVCSVLHKQNFQHIPEFIEELWSRGVRHFLFGNVDNFYKDWAEDPCLLAPEDILTVYEALRGVAKQYRGQGGQFILAFDHFNGSKYMNFLLEQGVFGPADVLEDVHGVLYAKPDPEGDFYLKLTLFPLSYRKIARITHDGFFLPNMMDLGKPDYGKYAVGNVRQEPVSVLSKRALEHPGFEAFYRSYLQRYYAL
jgi:MoaA/NifB/PqqE/SkfB family radical SAM enzyme